MDNEGGAHVYMLRCADGRYDAIAAERQIKGWSRPKKEALIRGYYEMIKLLARRSS